MTGLDPHQGAAENYRAFARDEAAGRCPAYETLANAVADDDVILRYLAQLPVIKQQPNLLFASARLLLADVPDVGAIRDLVQHRGEDLAAVMLNRRTQTNEVGRCAALVVALARLPGPLALIEVGASAGLALLLDQYSYEYDGHFLAGSRRGMPLLRCHVEGNVPLPQSLPTVVWREGLDLNPLDVTDNDDVNWLRCLVWPGQSQRDERLLDAIETARRDPPTVIRGDLLADLPAAVARAPAASTVVVFHSAVLAYVDPPTRRAFAELIRDLGVRWISNESVHVVPDLEIPDHSGAPFVLVEDGLRALAFTHPHGEWLHWID